MKLNKEQLQEGKISSDEVKASTSTPSDEEALRRESKVDEFESNAAGESEYEYVPISEVSHGAIAKILAFLREYSVIVLFILIALACFALSKLGSQMSAVFIAIAFAFIASAAAFILYEAWQQKKEAEAAYKHARDVREPVKRKMMHDSGDE